MSKQTEKIKELLARLSDPEIKEIIMATPQMRQLNEWKNKEARYFIR